MENDMYNRQFEYEDYIISYELSFSFSQGVRAKITEIKQEDKVVNILNLDNYIKEKILSLLEEEEAYINLFEYIDFEESYNESCLEAIRERNEER